MRGEKLAPRPALLELLVDRNEVLGVRTDHTKSLSWPKSAPSLVYRYDLRLDPREESPDVESATTTGGDLETLVEAAGALRKKPRARPVEIGADLKRRLGVLGYTDDESGRAPAPR